MAKVTFTVDDDIALALHRAYNTDNFPGCSFTDTTDRDSFYHPDGVGWIMKPENLVITLGESD